MFARIRRIKRRQEAAKCGKAFGVAMDGQRAYRIGQSPVMCPYILGTPAQKAWLGGWLAGYDREHDEQEAGR